MAVVALLLLDVAVRRLSDAILSVGGGGAAEAESSSSTIRDGGVRGDDGIDDAVASPTSILFAVDIAAPALLAVPSSLPTVAMGVLLCCCRRCCCFGFEWLVVLLEGSSSSLAVVVPLFASPSATPVPAPSVFNAAGAFLGGATD